MGEGDVDPAILWDWFVKSKNFLRHKGVSGLDMVKTVAYGMSGVHAIQWLAAKGPALPSMDWDEYKIQMRALFLNNDWKHTTCMEILCMCQLNTKPFMDFALEIMGKNNPPAGTNSFMNDDYMCETLEAAMEQELSRECNHENTASIEDFQCWLNEVKRIDEQHCARLDELTWEIAKMSIQSPVATRTPFQCSTANQVLTSSTKTFIPIPKLLQSECDLLSANGGCYKCRHFWANHIGTRCMAPPSMAPHTRP
ncbi:hypothetical protein BDN71DRAFT_1432637 [Pleurotus eryngii]|uniref:Uncharacterized protein n=1 Tax=Pleurotus eryngii TaxID=5323 RepID=A0A9P5ZUA8_PLEER|nr:hypothetical protein BDN71DRAFT_1432637 [Pleurotus eryngii]